MNTYSYATKDGKLKNFEAANENDALARVSSFGDSAKNSGVMAARTLPQPKKNVLAAQTLGTTNDTPATTYSAFTPISNAQAEQDAILAQQQAAAAANATQEIDEDAIYRDQLAMFQKEIDATNQIYAQMMSDQKIVGRGNLGSAGAIQARSGLLGSDFASGQNAEVQRQNKEAEGLVAAQQAAAIAQIQGLARRSAVEEIERKRQAQQQGLQDYITYLGQSNERRASKVNALRDQLLQQGVKLEDIDPSQLNKILKDFGITKDEVAIAYADEEVRRAQEAEKARIEAEDKAFERSIKSRFSLSPGETQYGLDAKGNVVALASRPVASTPIDAGQYGPSGQIEFDSKGAYIGNDPTFIGRTKAEVDSTRASRSGIYATLSGYTAKDGTNLGDKWLAGTLSKSDIQKLSDSDVKSIVTAKAQIDEPGKNINLTDAEVQRQVNASGLGGWVEQEYDKLFSGTNYEESEVKDILDTALVKSGGSRQEEIILTD